MKKSNTKLLPGLIMVFLCFSYDHINAQDVTGSWSGTISLLETVTHTLGHSERRITIFFTDNMGTGTVVEDGEYIVGGKLFCKSSCSGSGNAELHEVTIDKEAGTYRIHVISPRSTCTNTGPFCSELTTDNGFVDIIVSERPLDNNPNFLAGSETKVNDLAANGKSTTTIAWNLVRTIDIELIVTPQTYDMWLPEPGIDEETQGSVMNILLKVQGKNGRPLLQKAKAFELRLSNTSREPGITLNFPLHPGDPQPDLRFMMQPGADTSEAGQFISISCQSPCLTGSARIAAFDGGGWTTLTAFAILEDDTPIKGSLFVPTGEQEIPIPKRDVGSIIATAWLNANGNPNEMDDKETSAGNTNNGDGLTAYEEYRGVISETAFRRLDPKKKELGVRIKRIEEPLFSQAVSWFENASGLDIIPFYTYEIAEDRRINKNVSSAHDYDQFVLILKKGNLDKNVLGQVYTTTDCPDIPVRTMQVVIDIPHNAEAYQRQLAKNVQLPYTEAELIASTAAHELGHGVNIWHHGDPETEPPSPQTAFINSQPPYHIYLNTGIEVYTRPYILEGGIGTSGDQESGDLTCVMAYNPYSSWAFNIGANGSRVFYEVPPIPMGRNLCNSKRGTDINAPPINVNEPNKYFGNATVGNCLSQIKLRE